MAVLRESKKQRKEREFKEMTQWLLTVSDDFTFTGSTSTYEYLQSKEGLTPLQAFYIIETNGYGSKFTTTDTEQLKRLLRTKAAINMQIKLWAEGRADGTLPLPELEEVLKEYNAPTWVFDAIENQKFKYYKTNDSNN